MRITFLVLQLVSSKYRHVRRRLLLVSCLRHEGSIRMCLKPKPLIPC